MKQHLLFLSLFLLTCYATDFLSLDCNGDVSFSFQNWHNKFSISQLKNSYNTIHDILFSRLQCKCPSATKEEFLRRYAIATWDFHFHKLTSNPQDNSSTCAEQFPEWDNNYSLYDMGESIITAGKCNYDNWKNGNPCLLKFPVSYLDLEYQLAVGKCPNSYLPFVSLTCAGEGCKTLAMPCNIDSDCSANQKCETLPVNIDGSSTDSQTNKRRVEENQNEMKAIGNKMSSFVSAALTGSNPLTYASNLASKLVELVNPTSKSMKREVSQSNFMSDNAYIFQNFTTGMIYDANDTSPGCLTGSKFLTDFFSFVRSDVYNKNTPFAFENSPRLKFKICLFNVSDTEKTSFGVDQNNANPGLSLSTIKDWDGKLSDGSDVSNPDRIQGKTNNIKFDAVPTITPGATTLFHVSCSNQFSVLPRGNAGMAANLLYLASQPLYMNVTTVTHYYENGTFESEYENQLSTIAYPSIFAPILSQMTVKLPFINDLSNFWFSENFQIQSCRATARGKSLSVEEYKRRFGYSLAYALYFTTRMNAKSLQTIQMSDFIFDLETNIFVPPSTCTYENYLNTKSCTASFTGLQSLLGVDITINIKATECADYMLPSLYAECVGNDCKLLTSPIPCSTQSDCSNYPGTQCANFENQYTDQSDFVQAFFSHNITSDASTCSGKSKFTADIKKFLGALSGSTVNTLSFCVIDGSSWFTDKPNVNITEWAESQYIVSGDSFSIRDLKPWTPPTTNPNVENQKAVVGVKLEIPESNQSSDLDRQIKEIIAKSLGIDPKFIEVTLTFNGNEVNVEIVVNKVAADGSVLPSDPNNVAASVRQELSNPNSGASTTLGKDLGAVVKSTTFNSSQSNIISFFAIFVVLCLVSLF